MAARFPCLDAGGLPLTLRPQSSFALRLVPHMAEMGKSPP